MVQHNGGGGQATAAFFMWPGSLGAWHGRPAGGIGAGANTGKMPLPPRAIDYAETRADREGPVGGLARGAKRATVAGVMSATEIIELIEKLPPQDKAEVIAYVRKAGMAPAEQTIRYLPDDEAERIAERIFRDHSELFRKLAQ